MEAGGPPLLLALAGALVLAVVHLEAGRLRFLDATPRSAWLSAAGGISVAYVFVHLLPELSRTQEQVEEGAGGALPFLEDHVYVLALTGLAVFYGVERSSQASRARRRDAGQENRTDERAFRLSMGSFAVYNALIGYLLVHREDTSLQGLALYVLALGLHFVVNDHGLREHHKDAYHRVGRWILVLAILLGWALGALTEIPEAAVGLVIAFLAGGVVLNVLKEELPEERESRLWAFLAGAAGYTVLLQAA